MNEPDNLDPMTSITVPSSLPEYNSKTIFFSRGMFQRVQRYGRCTYLRAWSEKKKSLLLLVRHSSSRVTVTRSDEATIRSLSLFPVLRQSAQVGTFDTAVPRLASRSREWADKAVDASSRLPRASKKGQLTQACRQVWFPASCIPQEFLYTS